MCQLPASAACTAGTKLKAEGRQQQALELYQEAVAMDGQYAPGHYNLAVLLSEQGQVGSFAYMNACILETARGAAHACV